jgi:hypothetical protein
MQGGGQADDAAADEGDVAGFHFVFHQNAYGIS